MCFLWSVSFNSFEDWGDDFFVNYSLLSLPFLFHVEDFTFPLWGGKYNLLVVAGETGMVSVHSNRKFGDVASFGNKKWVPHLSSISAKLSIADFFRILQDRK